MTVTVYLSTDVGAPVLSGQAGTLVAVLDACLVNGYGSMAPAGWTKEFSSPNHGVYRASIGTRYYLRVDDTAVYTTAVNAFVRGYETMSDEVTGTNPFPTVSKATYGMTIKKSSAISTSPRNWMVIAHERSFYMVLYSNNSNDTPGSVVSSQVSKDSTCFFGEILSYKPTNDPYNCFLTNLDDFTGPTFGDQTTGTYGARGVDGTDVTHAFGRRTCYANLGNPVGVTASDYQFPDLISNELGLTITEMIEQVTGTQFAATARGRCPGLYVSAVSRPVHAAFLGRSGPGHIVNGAGNDAGRQFMPVTLASYSAALYAYIELTDNWYTL